MDRDAAVRADLNPLHSLQAVVLWGCRMNQVETILPLDSLGKPAPIAQVFRFR
jgi:hypothetical protein